VSHYLPPDHHGTRPGPRPYVPPPQPAPPEGPWEHPPPGPSWHGPGHPGPQYGAAQRHEGPFTEVAAPPRRLSARGRRITELTALAVLLVVTVGLRWYDDASQARALERPERVDIVTRGQVSTLGQVEWRMLGRVTDRDASPATPSSGPAPGAVQLTLLVEARPQSGKGVEALTRPGLTFRVRDRAGHVWSATPEPLTTVRAGAAVRLPVRAKVPPDRLGSVVLEVLPALSSAPARGPLPVLRFAH
jgi:hypothetical protein